MNSHAQQVIVVQTTKNPGIAAILGCIFGPIGLLYSTLKGAVVMFFVNIVVAVLTAGFGLLVTWPICGIWGYKAAKTYNENLTSSIKTS